jgi:spore coat polysaccharide biosynthesis protein SpsF
VTVAIVQARMGSSRLPGKALRQLGGRSVLSWVVRAVRDSEAIAEVVVATTHDDADDAIVEACATERIPCVRGPRDDVLRRFLLTLEHHPADTVVRLTGDCPLLDPSVIRMVVRAHAAGDVEYLSTLYPRSLPRGLDVEVVAAGALRRADGLATGAHRAHVTSFVATHPEHFRVANLSFVPSADDLRVTIDTEDDARLLDAIVDRLGDRPPPWRELVALLRARPELVRINAHVRQKALEEA